MVMRWTVAKSSLSTSQDPDQDLDPVDLGPADPDHDDLAPGQDPSQGLAPVLGLSGADPGTSLDLSPTPDLSPSLDPPWKKNLDQGKLLSTVFLLTSYSV